MKETMERLGNAYTELQNLRLQPTEHNLRILVNVLAAMREAYYEMDRMDRKKPEAGQEVDPETGPEEEPEAGPEAGQEADPETGLETGPEEEPEPGKEEKDGNGDRV